MYSRFFKRIVDFILSLIGIVVLSPIFLIILLGLYFANRGRPFFLQMRPGKNERFFKIIKFRTMNDKRDAQGNLLPDSERLTKLGKIVRKTSLDEIPQLFNVLMGDMSLIGPRPLLVEYLSLYSDSQKRRHTVRPGITGWAQVNGRNAITWQEKFEFDVWYIENISLQLDIKILLKTIKKVFKREGINAEGAATIQPFNGN